MSEDAREKCQSTPILHWDNHLGINNFVVLLASRILIVMQIVLLIAMIIGSHCLSQHE